MKVRGTFLSGILVLGLSLSVAATVLRVPSEYPTIQAGIDAAADGDTVLVADGTYSGAGNRHLDFGGVNMVVMSENGPASTVIDCEQSGRGFHFHTGENEEAVVRGFTIENGYAVGGWIEGCGGAILCNGSSPTIEGNIISDNTSTWNGGGILCYNGFLAMIADNTIVGNVATRNGGGIICHSGSAIVRGNIISGNVGGSSGGGIHYYLSSGSIEGNLIADNSGGPLGGGIVCSSSSPPIGGNTIVGNMADDGGGICWYNSTGTVTNSIVWGNNASTGPQISGPCTVTYSDVQDGWPGVGNIDADPLFATGPQGDYYLSQTIAGQPEQSPCVDGGDPDSAVPEGTTRTDEVCDVWPPDMGYHYYPCTAGPTPLLWVCVTPDTTQVVRGEDLWFSIDVVNVTDSTLTFDGWVDAYLLNGNPYARNPALGPVEITLGGNGGLYGVRRHVRVPMGAPFGEPYRLCCRTGAHPDSIWVEDCFEFAIVWPPAE